MEGLSFPFTRHLRVLFSHLCALPPPAPQRRFVRKTSRAVCVPPAHTGFTVKHRTKTGRSGAWGGSCFLSKIFFFNTLLAMNMSGKIKPCCCKMIPHSRRGGGEDASSFMIHVRAVNMPAVTSKLWECRPAPKCQEPPGTAAFRALGDTVCFQLPRRCARYCVT